MFCTVFSGAIQGIDSHIIKVEVDTAQALPGFDMVGFLGREVQEARERVKIALKNAGISLPPIRITVNLSPANIRKEGTAFDLPIAVGILVSLGYVPENCIREILFIGELGLNGEIKPVKGTLPIVMEGKEQGIKRFLVPKQNALEGSVTQGEVIGVESLQQVLKYLPLTREQQEHMLSPVTVNLEKLFSEKNRAQELDFQEIQGQFMVKKGVEIAAAGFHNMLMSGPPGSGKTMLAKRIPGILPPLTLQESLEVSKIYSVSGLLKQEEALLTSRPFLSPHHTISEQALAGGGAIPRPGVMSLSHRGVLFLDELPEFKRATLEIMRQPMEDKRIHIARTYGTVTYPADFMLIGAMNPCPCGYYPDRNRCRCKAHEIRRYLNRISGPIIDRIDICAQAAKVEIKDLTEKQNNESSTVIRERVMEARKRQQHRYRATCYQFNADVGAKDMDTFCRLGKKEALYMEKVFKTLDLSARAYHKTIKVARTIADLEGKEKIGEQHISRAVCFRMINLEEGLTE